MNKRITGFRANAKRDTAGRTFHDPIIDLDDGSFLFFVVEETFDGTQYGVFVGRGHRP